MEGRLADYRADLLGLVLTAFFATLAVLGVVLVLGLLPMSAGSAPVLVVAAVFVLPILALALSNWVLGVYLLAVLVPFENLLTFGSYTSGAKALTILVFVCLGLRLLWDHQLQLRLKDSLMQPLVLFAGAFSAWSMASIMWAQRPDVAAVKSVTFLGLLGLMIAVGLLEKRQLAVLWAVIACSTVLSIPVGYMMSTGESHRFSAGGLDPNDFAGLLVVVFLVAYYGLLRRFKVAAFLMALAISVGLLTSQSRTGLVALAAAPVLALWIPRLTSRLAGRTVLLYGFAAAAFAGLLIATPSLGGMLAERYSSLAQYQSADTWTGRWSLWQAAFQIIAAHPITGIGAGNYPYMASSYSLQALHLESVREGAAVAHNMFLSVASELGMVGLILFSGILFFAFRAAFGRLDDVSGLGTGLFLGLVAFTIAGMTLSWEYQKLAYLLYGSVLALRLQGSSEDPGEEAPGDRE